MSLVDVILTIDESDKLSEYDYRVLDALERRYLSRSQLREGLLPHVNKALERARALRNKWLGRRPLELSRCLYTDDCYTHLVVALPLGSTWRAVNAGYMFLSDLLAKTTTAYQTSAEFNSEIRDFAHKSIIPLLDAAGEFSRYPVDVKIAFDLMFTLKLALTEGQIGKGAAETIDSSYLDMGSPISTVGTVKRETSQLLLIWKYRPIPG